MGASISKGYSQGKGKSMRKRTMKRGKGKKRTMKKGTMKKQRGGYVYSGTRQHRSTALARGVSLNRPKSHKKSRKNKSRKSRK